MDAIGKQHSFDYCMYMMLISGFTTVVKVVIVVKQEF